MYHPGKIDVHQHITQTTDLEYLKQLDKYVDADIENMNKVSDRIKKMQADMRNLTVEEMEKRQLDSFLKLKELIKTRISELT